MGPNLMWLRFVSPNVPPYFVVLQSFTLFQSHDRVFIKHICLSIIYVCPLVSMFVQLLLTPGYCIYVCVATCMFHCISVIIRALSSVHTTSIHFSAITMVAPRFIFIDVV